ncbi:MAG: hypothetical protein K1V76_07400 [Candidatus Amulumruptor sp.]
MPLCWKDAASRVHEDKTLMRLSPGLRIGIALGGDARRWTIGVRDNGLVGAQILGPDTADVEEHLTKVVKGA